MTTIYSVRELSSQIKILLEDSFPFVWVRGQVTNLSRPSSGHVYFSLKDEDAVLGAVWFRQSRFSSKGAVNPLTGEVNEHPDGDPADTLADGKEIICGGRLNVYAPRGTYQLVVDLVQDLGLGPLHQQFEELKKRFAAKGWFDLERKRPVPLNPGRVALVTAPTGAAQADFLRIASDRGLGAQVRLYASLVQGNEAPASIARAMQAAVAEGWAQVVVLIRGGGSLEDLWAFNTEEVARAVYRSPVPVVAGIGHEVDMSIADMIADVRAATPTHAAQLLWSERSELAQMVDGVETRASRAFSRLLAQAKQSLDNAERQLSLASPLRRLAEQERVADTLSRRLAGAMARTIRDGGRRYAMARDTLVSRSPLRSVADSEHGVGQMLARMGKSLSHRFERLEAGLGMADARLNVLDPLGPLERGYGLARMAGSGEFIRSIGDVEQGREMEFFVRDGRVRTTVSGTDQATLLDEGTDGDDGKSSGSTRES